MILHRFCSQEEFDRYMRGELLVNEKDHSKFSKSTSIGFCWFWEEPWYAIEHLSGIVNRDICITVETDSKNVTESMGYYWGEDGPDWFPNTVALHTTTNDLDWWKQQTSSDMMSRTDRKSER